MHIFLVQVQKCKKSVQGLAALLIAPFKLLYVITLQIKNVDCSVPDKSQYGLKTFFF